MNAFTSWEAFHLRFIVCSLDFTLTIAFALGSCRQVSTPSSFDAWLGIRSLNTSPNLTSYI